MKRSLNTLMDCGVSAIGVLVRVAPMEFAAR
jgi:hypothetical protein